MKDLSSIADAATTALVNGDRKRFNKLFEWACEVYDEEDARVAFVEGLCCRAGQARREAQHIRGLPLITRDELKALQGTVSRLKDAAYKVESESLSRDDIRRILRREGAIGYQPPQRRETPRARSLAAIYS